MTTDLGLHALEQALYARRPAQAEATTTGDWPVGRPVGLAGACLFRGALNRFLVRLIRNCHHSPSHIFRRKNKRAGLKPEIAPRFTVIKHQVTVHALGHGG